MCHIVTLLYTLLYLKPDHGNKLSQLSPMTVFCPQSSREKTASVQTYSICEISGVNVALEVIPLCLCGLRYSVWSCHSKGRFSFPLSHCVMDLLQRLGLGSLFCCIVQPLQSFSWQIATLTVTWRLFFVYLGINLLLNDGKSDMQRGCEESPNLDSHSLVLHCETITVSVIQSAEYAPWTVNLLPHQSMKYFPSRCFWQNAGMYRFFEKPAAWSMSFCYGHCFFSMTYMWKMRWVPVPVMSSRL